MRGGALAAVIILFGLADHPAAAEDSDRALLPGDAIAGWHLGLNAGGDWGAARTSTVVGNAPPGSLASFKTATATGLNQLGSPSDIGTSGFVGGVQGGYDFDIGQWDLGLETDFDTFQSQGSKDNTTSIMGLGLPPAGEPATIRSSTNTNWLLTARPRFGIVLDGSLVYATAGVAISRLQGAWNTVVPQTEAASSLATRYGWVLGLGFETPLAERYTIGLQYLYVKFSDVSATSNAYTSTGVLIGNPFTHRTDLQSNSLVLRVSTYFD